jgi:co-chaperonin GroES (HSP10)
MNAFRRILPLLNRVVIKRMELPAKSAGGIILPDNKDKDSVIG